MDYTKEAGLEPIPGYRLIEPLGKGGFGEVWKCTVPGGMFKAIKFLYGNLDAIDSENTAQMEFEALERVKAIRHPFVLSLERVEVIDGELLMVMELADKNLEDRFAECQGEGLVGIRKEELLPLLRDAAEALDLLNFQHDLQHLDIKPSNLFVVGNHVKLADFGLVQGLEELNTPGVGEMRCGLTPLYSPPEMLQGKGSRQCDQYSLAIVYQQLLTGKLPFEGTNVRQLMMQHMMAAPDLTSLSPDDRVVVGKALAKKPEERYSSCEEFIGALFRQRETVTDFAMPGLRSSSTELRPVTPPAVDNGQPKSQSLSFPENPYKNTPSIKRTRAFGSFGGENGHQSDEASNRDFGLPEAPVIPGLEPIECIQTGPMGEVWKMSQQNGRNLLVRALPKIEGVEEAIQQYSTALADLQNELLIQPKVAHHEGYFFLAMAYDHPLLTDRFRASVAQGQVGIARSELLNHLARAGRLLDELAQKNGVPHLCLNPQSMLLDDNTVRLTDFGLVAYLWYALERPIHGINPRYIAPEVLSGAVSSAADQYSLAMIYAEMLTGFHPRPKPLSGRSRAGLRLDLTFLPTADKEVVERALEQDPTKRFESCSEFLNALGVRYRSTSKKARPPLPPVIAISQLQDSELRSQPGMPKASACFEDFFYQFADVRSFHDTPHCQYVLKTDSSLQCQVMVRLPESVFREKLEAFAQEWQSELQCPGANKYLIRISEKRKLFSRLLSGDKGLEIELVPQPSAHSRTLFKGASICVRNFGRMGAQEMATARQEAGEMLNLICGHLQAAPFKRRQLRVSFKRNLIVHPVRGSGRVDTALQATARDISLEGLGFALPQKLPGNKIYLQVDAPTDKGPLAILFTIVREKENGSQFEYGGVVGELAKDKDASNETEATRGLVHVF